MVLLTNTPTQDWFHERCVHAPRSGGEDEGEGEGEDNDEGDFLCRECVRVEPFVHYFRPAPLQQQNHEADAQVGEKRGGQEQVEEVKEQQASSQGAEGERVSGVKRPAPATRAPSAPSASSASPAEVEGQSDSEAIGGGKRAKLEEDKAQEHRQEQRDGAAAAVCVRPQLPPLTAEGHTDLYLPFNWQDSLCRCGSCLDSYAQHKCSWVLEEAGEDDQEAGQMMVAGDEEDDAELSEEFDPAVHMNRALARMPQDKVGEPLCTYLCKLDC